jgi:hypothetical protein
MSQSISLYRPVAQIYDSVASSNPSSSNWGLGVNYENTIRNISDSIG